MTERSHERSRTATEPPGYLIHQWVAAGIVSGASRFIPVPFVDDMVRGQCRRFAVARTLASHSVPISADDLKPYHAVGDGFLSGIAGKVMRVPLKLLLFPIRKTVAVVTSIRGVPLEIIRVVLMGRTLERCLRDGRLVGDRHVAAKIAARMRVAFDEAFARMDFHVIRAATSDALSGVSGWKEAAIASADKLATGEKAVKQDLHTGPEVDTGASRVQEVLDRPETLRLFAEFDRRFDLIFARLP